MNGPCGTGSLCSEWVKAVALAFEFKHVELAIYTSPEFNCVELISSVVGDIVNEQANHVWN